jgi:hypothetical protein
MVARRTGNFFAHRRQMTFAAGELALLDGWQSLWLKLGFMVYEPPADWSAL